jgi:hypothetical protein
MNATTRALAGSFMLCALVLALSGCYPLPVRSPTRVADSAPTPSTIDLAFLKKGSTTRDEVQTKLASINTGAGDSQFFWGRPRVSKYRLVMMVGYIPLPVYPGDKGQVEKPPRWWGTENLLVGYDDRGVVKSWTLARDDRLIEELDRVSDAASSPLDLSLPLYVNSVLILNAGSAECFGVEIARARLRKIVARKGSDTDDVRVRMFFDRPVDFSHTKLGKKTGHLDLALDPPSLLLLRRYIKQTQHAASAPSAAD